jgi:DNA-binding protein HU-beta
VAVAYTKANLVEDVAGAAGADKATVERVLDAFFSNAVSQAQRGNKVAWPGFGSFSLSQRSARTGRNPQTGAAVKIPASKAMKFSASSVLKEALNARSAKKAAPAKKGAAKKAAPAKKAAKSTRKR